MKALKTIAAFVPGPFLVFAGQWISLLSSTVIANPVWQVAADKLALGVGAILTLFVSIGWADASKEVLKQRFCFGCGAVILGITFCWAIWFHLRPPAVGAVDPYSAWWQDVWFGVYFVTTSILAPTISTGALSVKEDKPWLFRLVAIVAVLAVLVIVLIFWRR